MCGIAGVVNFGDTELLPRDRWASFTDPLKYRGPDDRGDWHHRSDTAAVSFFHTRLSIIDLNPTGHQPMVSDDQKVVIVFNGEIYNYKQVKQELIQKGYAFRSTSDTEVLLQGYKCWGFRDLLNRIDGMFAMALFDKTSNALFLARDRFGKKPLYYSVQDRHLVFSSDIRSFKAVSRLSFDIDLHALGYFFAEYGTPQENTIWKQIRKVKPASYLQFDLSGVSAYEKYWTLRYTANCALDHQSIVEKTESLLSSAVKKRLVADVRVSSLLSGGIDSSVMVAKMAEVAGEKIRTYSVGFKEDDFNELPFARQVAERFDTDHTTMIIDPNDLQDMDCVIMEFGEPFADSSMIPTYLMSKEIAKNEKVVLGGDGGDELFGGYDSYYFAYQYDRVKSFRALYPLSRLLSTAFHGYRMQFLNRLLKQSQSPAFTLLDRHFCFDGDDLKNLNDSNLFERALEREHESIWREYGGQGPSDLIRVMSASMRTRLLSDYLVKVDRASMFASLEMRSPYLDKDLAEFAATLKPRQIFYQGEPKAILKDVASKYFNREFVRRKKMGFGIPIGNWFRDALSHRLKEVVLAKQNLVDLNYSFIEKLVDEHTRGVADHREKMWALYVFHLWANRQ